MRGADVVARSTSHVDSPPKARDDELPSKSFKDAGKPRARSRRRISLMS
jgi:hypothetical protein